MPRDAHTDWAAVTADAPGLAAQIRARFAAHPHHVLGTLRATGAPRLNGTEVHIGGRMSLVRVEHDELVITTWDPGHGVSETRRR